MISMMNRFKRAAKNKALAKARFQLPKKQMIGVVNVGNAKIRHGISKSEITWLNSLNVPERSKLFRGFQGKIYITDGYDPKTKTVFEFNGNFAHGAHNVYPKNRDIKTWLGKTPNELYYGTIERYNYFYSLGYKVFFVWESDWKKHISSGRYYRGPGDNLY